ncbi:1-phosphatidylinositol 4,5-bisphosphate phosphodiesterase classes I and II-like Protein [Tribolium castaneum]|uniref:1-phosphatidylinositol 4,5-bisphosphate phosphodiesterase n=1 Tax=Tribolium castaneum TaxID=7070 RepID=A0A139WIL1_TRICA|nr:PREDICTED: 1-phosphatidylinositol 4,5-bisphosphate phosphodiesterase classes I and II [Tribolium castaneum]KYB27786.1 1-phosphatidylinositol 4,5-bisphosphate phosphodiesterase classes I and II-like Protein [Tribolium castaneum]|eukprot:XP_008191652.1 PREDICTED: 1-phosphatidylinositol 4,5-bisphosphate phosphodiesterase classes I and II [Tribolium castaneum]
MSATPGGRTGAAATPSNAVSLKSIEVPQALQNGEKFIKWDEDSGVGTPVTLRVDKYGFYLHWVDQNHEMDLLDIATIRDTRTGRYAKIPKDPKLRQIVTMGSQDTLEEKTVTVCCANDFVNMNFINFCCTRKEIARLWTDALMSLAYNLNQINGTANLYLLKAYTKLILVTDKTGKIPIKNIIKMFAQSRDDKRRIETVLQSTGLPYGKNDTLSPEKFQFEDFFNFYKNLTQRSEIEKVFNDIVGSKKHMTAAQFVDFLNKTQRDPRLNEILHPYANTARAKDIIAQYEPNKYNAQKGQLSFDGFLRYLMSEDNNIIAPSKYELCDEMDHPLAHYFINSSHNTYLTGHQLTGKSSTEMYRQCLLAGCRCVELDFWNGREEPIIVHGYTFVPEISAREVLEAIAESAFKTSDFPVVLSFENHCNPRQQAKIANYCREIFGEMLLEAPLEAYKLEPGQPLPPPSVLKRKIIIKNKKKHHHHHHHHHHHKKSTSAQPEAPPSEPTGNGDVPHHAPPLQANCRQGSKDSTGTEDEESSSDEDGETLETDNSTEPTNEGSDHKAATAGETEAGAEISALVNYVQPVHFTSFENAKKKNRSYEMSSFDEKQATSLLKEYPVQFVNYNKHQLSRVYPAGTRFDSSNFMPQVFWNAGCQLVALNFQTLDLAMQLNLGIFEYNFRCGYLLKPEFMRRTDRRFYPFAESTVDGIIAGTVKITVISGQFLTDKRVGTYVEVEMYGLPADTVRKRFRTKTVPNNGINPVYDEEPFVFKKVVLPDLASIRIAAYEESGRFIGHRVLPVVGLCPGYRHVNLRTEIGQPLPLATLFLHIVVKDYVPDGLSDFAEALANPIKYQSDLEKRAQQLAVLTDDMEPAEGTEDQKKNSLSAKEQATNGSPIQRPLIATGAASVDATSDNEGPVIATSVDTKNPQHDSNSLPKNIEVKEEKFEELIAEPLDKILDNKLVKEKKLELDKKLENLRKKHEKKKMTLQSQKSGDFSEKRSRLINMKLVKRLSSKNIVSGVFSTESPSVEPLTCVADGPETSSGDPDKPSLPRSHSERLLSVNRDFVCQEKELREKYHEVIYNTAEKVMKISQNNQLKTLKDQFERETTDLMRKLQADHREEVKALAKKHRNREQFTRVKREAESAVVGRGVSEREKLGQIFESRREELQRQHEAVKDALAECRNKAKVALLKEFETRMARVESESGGVL